MLRLINEYLDTKNASDRRILAILAFLISAFLSYLLFFEASNSLLSDKNSKNAQALQKLNDIKQISLKDFDISNKDKILKTYENKLNTTIQELKSTKLENELLHKRLNEALQLLPSTKNWAKFLDDIAILAKQNQISIKEITNSQTSAILGHISQILSINIKASGEFKDILKFLSETEMQIPLLKIKNLLITSNSNTLDFELVIGIWGIAR
ncbi:type 4a pilus biogenesis protein PilO [Campylobacter sp. 9BO]|uniref:type 4a pilus biogenesis protein PilO n=1 Tax=Campylobacter sp. 9BO TaxID=3424759 RepID=UPI003D331B1E